MYQISNQILGEAMASFTGVQAVFAYCILIGGALFLVRLVLMFVGMGDHDVDHSGEVGHDADHGHLDSDVAFKLLSFQGMLAFLLMFGLVGLAASRSSKLPNGISFLLALLGGLAIVWLLNKMFRLFGRLQHAGNIDLANALDQTGTVYSNITPEEAGKVTVPVQGRLLTLDAIPLAPYTLATGTQVHIHAILHGRVLVVEPVEQRNEKEL
jgi:membrane protein implicated in regulation of membrane protease activity